MNKKSIEYNCNICNKEYKTYQTWWKHNKHFHKNIYENCQPMTNIRQELSNKSQNLLCKIILCDICNKQFNTRQAKSAHKKKCSQVKTELDQLKEDNKNKELELLIKREEATIKREEKAILKLQIKLQNANRIDNCSLKKLNKILLERNTRIKNSNVNSTVNSNNVQNNIVNNFMITGFGEACIKKSNDFFIHDHRIYNKKSRRLFIIKRKEEIVELLTYKEKKQILNAKYNSLEKLIEIIHCGKYNQFKNIIITNMKDNYMYKYDDGKGQFIISTKSEVLNSLVDNRVYDLNVIYNDLLNENKINEETKDAIERFINKINYSDQLHTDFDGKEHTNYKQYKISEIKILLFNNQDKITNDISLWLTTNEV